MVLCGIIDIWIGRARKESLVGHWKIPGPWLSEQGDSKIANGSCVVTMSSQTARASEARRQLPWSSS